MKKREGVEGKRGKRGGRGVSPTAPAAGYNTRAFTVLIESQQQKRGKACTI